MPKLPNSPEFISEQPYKQRQKIAQHRQSVSKHKTILVLEWAASSLTALAAQKQPYFLSWCSWGLASAVFFLLERIFFFITDGQNAFSHGLNQESLTVLNIIGKSRAGKLPHKCLISQNRLQMETESYVNYHKHLVLLLHLQQLFPDVFSQHSCSVLCHFLPEAL